MSNPLSLRDIPLLGGSDLIVIADKIGYLLFGRCLPVVASLLPPGTRLQAPVNRGHEVTEMP